MSKDQKEQSNVPPIVVRPAKDSDDITNRGFQSKDALKAATAKPEEQVEDEIGNTSGIVSTEEYVTVRPRITIPRFRYGPTWYSVKANVRTRVPKSVARHLEEKGIV